MVNDQKIMRQLSGHINAWPKLTFVAFALAVGSLSVHAVPNSNAVPPMVGHKPTADSVAFDNPTPLVGDTLTVTYDYDDKEGDVEGVPTVKWLRDGVEVVGETGTSITPLLNTNTGAGNACTPFSIAAEITPTSLTGEPRIGNAKAIAPVTVALAVVPDFSLPSSTTRSWIGSYDYCAAQGGRLPLGAELQSVFNSQTSGGINLQMAELHGWPLTGLCGGGNMSYWAAGLDVSGRNIFVGMDTGVPKVDSNNAAPRYAACRTGTISIAAADFTIPTNTAVANNSAANVARVVVKNEKGDLQGGVPVTFEVISGVASPTSRTVNTNVSGVAESTFTSGTAGNANVRATPKGYVATATKSMDFCLQDGSKCFTKPDTTVRTWPDADTFCRNKGGGYRLPTRVELQNLFVNKTSATAIHQNNNEMCDKHGWPLGGGRCGGSYDIYWTGEPDTNNGHWHVSMFNAVIDSNFDPYPFHATCVR